MEVLSLIRECASERIFSETIFSLSKQILDEILDVVSNLPLLEDQIKGLQTAYNIVKGIEPFPSLADDNLIDFLTVNLHVIET